MNNNYILFYKKDDLDHWHYSRPDLPFEQWEDYAKEQKYSIYDVKDLAAYNAGDLHLLTDIVFFNNRYYLPEEELPYPDYDADDIGKFDISIEWQDEKVFYETDYDEIYQGIEKLLTDINITFSVKQDMKELGIAAQIFIKFFPQYLEKLQVNKQAVYINEEFSPFKWLSWIKNDKVRIIHQDYKFQEVKTDFDILVDKTWFFKTCQEMIFIMKYYVYEDQKRYEKYVKEKYGKIL